MIVALVFVFVLELSTIDIPHCMTLQLIPQVSGKVRWLTAVAARDRFVPHDIPVKGNATVRAVMSCLSIFWFWEPFRRDQLNMLIRLGWLLYHQL